MKANPSTWHPTWRKSEGKLRNRRSFPPKKLLRCAPDFARETAALCARTFDLSPSRWLQQVGGSQPSALNINSINFALPRGWGCNATFYGHESAFSACGRFIIRIFVRTGACVRAARVHGVEIRVAALKSPEITVRSLHFCTIKIHMLSCIHGKM